MAKSVYKIRASINRSILDYEPPIAMGSLRIVRPMRVILFVLVSILAGIAVLFASPITGAGIGWKIALGIWWILVTLTLSKYSKTKEMRLSSLIPLWKYLPKSARFVSTRKDSESYPLREIVGIKDISSKGLIEYLDGTVGQAYLVVGSGSVLLFEEDRNNILDRASAFWRRAEKDVEYIAITTKEPQRVGSQLKHINDLRSRMKVVDEDLVDLLYERFEVMQKNVGRNLSSIHQYLILKGENIEVLRRAHADLASEVEESQLFLKQCSMLDRTATLNLLKFFYQLDHAEDEKTGGRK